MKTLKAYEDTSGQLINGDKIHFMLHPNSFITRTDGIRRIIGFKQKQGSLGCPLYVGRPRIIYCFELVNKVIWRIKGWQTKQLSYGGKAILMKHVLQYLPIHILSATTPPFTILKHIQMLMAEFFCGRINNNRKYLLAF